MTVTVTRDIWLVHMNLLCACASLRCRVRVSDCICPQILLETAFRNYSALSVGETIVIDVYGTNHWLDVVETRPENAVSLLGTVDLEVDFAPAQVRLSRSYLSICARRVTM